MSKRRRKPRRHINKPPRPLGRKAFERELTKVLNGDPDADPHVRAFFDDMRAARGIEVALPHPDGVEVLRRKGGTRD